MAGGNGKRCLVILLSTDVILHIIDCDAAFLILPCHLSLLVPFFMPFMGHFLVHIAGQFAKIHSCFR